jgi:hypothetical protein
MKVLRGENEKMKNVLQVYWLFGPIAVTIRESSTDSRGGINTASISLKKMSFDNTERGCYSALSRYFTTKVSAAMWSSQSQLTMNLKRRISNDVTDMKKQNFVIGSQNDRAILIREKRKVSIRKRPALTEFCSKRC